MAMKGGVMQMRAVDALRAARGQGGGAQARRLPRDADGAREAAQARATRCRSRSPSRSKGGKRTTVEVKADGAAAGMAEQLEA